MRFKYEIHFLVFIISLFFFSCSKGENYNELEIENAYTKIPLIGKNAVSAYMSLTNLSNEDIPLNKISCSGSKKAFFHDIQLNPDTDMISMNQLNNLIISPGETKHFTPGNKHIMILGLTSSLGINDKIFCILGTEKGKSFPVFFTVK